MDESRPETGTGTVASSYPDWDVDSLLERVWDDLGGTVSRSTIHQVLTEVIPNYESARVQTFVPIFVHRETVKRLRAGLAEVPEYHSAAVMPDTGLAVADRQS